jgi:hypothetical protein
MWRLSSLSAALSRAVRWVAWALLAIAASGCESLAPGASPACTAEPSGILAGGPPRHTADDALVVDHEEVSVEGRFASAGVRVCAYTKTDGIRWVLRGEGQSSAGGWVSVVLAPIAAPGDYPVRLEMPQDGTGAEATIFVRARGTHLAVFDVDGTLTRSEVWPAFLQGHLAEPRPFAVDLAETLRERGCLIVYLSARTHEMTDATRMWRDHWGFPRGVVHLSSSPFGLTGPRAAAFKLAFLEAAREGPHGPRFIVDFAFGNRPSDLAAYSAAAPTATIYLMDYGAAKDEGKAPTTYRRVYDTWKQAVDELPPPPADRSCR